MGDFRRMVEMFDEEMEGMKTLVEQIRRQNNTLYDDEPLDRGQKKRRIKPTNITPKKKKRK